MPSRVERLLSFENQLAVLVLAFPFAGACPNGTDCGWGSGDEPSGETVLGFLLGATAAVILVAWCVVRARWAHAERRARWRRHLEDVHSLVFMPSP